ncbi:MAG TPA: isoaspartyl peptidase/L-asparaginase family protein [Candidatus Binatia bacterium]|jgi:beta-aspartyl-peptidase (threonine type)|nr:isoaspartyl peptidase/L-asparaginase family protein [Candidatus Binatia bacterium]
MKPALILHGGAGSPAPDLAGAREQGLRRAFAAAWAILRQNESAVDAVVRATVELENDPLFNAGVGSCLNQEGNIEVDASLMDGPTLRGGVVGAVRNLRNPILLARAVMEAGRHVFLVGDGAERFARAQGFPVATREELVTARQWQRWQAAQALGEPGTVGAVALDSAGHLAAATSTGGIFNKLPGRVGDSAVIGAGTYADDTLGAGSATGDGEAIIRTTLTRTALELLRDGRDPTQAARLALDLLRKRTNGEGGLILLDPLGRIGYAYNTPAMSVAFLAGDRLVVRE